ncbi:MAG: Rieske 2Fe-2S domain-containing protein [Myxococcales bacterium]|nr:MAG: Rieske 2Fe-2S domain-containing protein [Myxococcales bacterium]
MTEHWPSLTTGRFPRGWFVIGFSEELESGQVRPARYFDIDLAIWRTSAGEPRVFDAFCPHLGAHLGHGGQVEGDSIRCPFHAWGFDSTGKCTDIPYAKRVPPKAQVRSWPTLERNGMVMLWHDPAGGQPEDYVPIMDEFGAEGWTPWVHRMAQIKTHPREVVENVADIAHFGPIHGNEVLSFDAKFEGPTATQSTRTTAYDKKGRLTKQRTVATYYGPGIQFSKMDGEFNTIILNAHIPIDENNLELRMGLLVQGIDYDTRLGRTLGEMWIDALHTGYFQDVAIWEHKQWQDEPMLCDGDGPIADLRRWYAQFYEDIAC